MLNVGNIWTFLSSPRNWFHLQAIRVLWFSKLTQVNEELCVNLKFLWSSGKNSTCWIFEDCRHIGLGNLKPPFCAGTPGERPHGNVTGMVQQCLRCFLCVQLGSISIYSAGAHWLQTEFLSLLSWALLHRLPAKAWLQSLLGFAKGGQRGPCSEVTLVTELQCEESSTNRSKCPLRDIPSFLSWNCPCCKITADIPLTIRLDPDVHLISGHFVKASLIASGSLAWLM